MDAVVTIMIDARDEEDAAAARDSIAGAAAELGVAVKSWASAMAPTAQFVVSGVDTSDSAPFSEVVSAADEAEAGEIAASGTRVVAHVQRAGGGDDAAGAAPDGAHGMDDDGETERQPPGAAGRPPAAGKRPR